MAQKVLHVYVDHSLGSLSHPTKIPTLALPPFKNLGVKNFFMFFTFAQQYSNPFLG